MTTRGAAKPVSGMIYELYRPDKEKIKLEILFVHGLQFDSLEPDIHLYTWKSGDLASQEIWPKTWLRERFPSARILTIRYDSSMITTDDSGRFDLHNAAENLARDLLDHAGVGKSTACPVIFVGHGVGGLLIKELCLHVNQSRSLSKLPQEKKKMECFLRSVKGLFFYGTPHRGMAEPDGKTMQNPSPLMEFVKLMGPHAARLHEDLDILREDYKWAVGGVGESKATRLAWGKERSSWLELILTGGSSGSCSQDGFSGVVVPEASARYGTHRGGFTTVDADHFTLCQPETRTSNSYLRLVGFVEQVTGIVEEPRKRPRSDTSLSMYVPLPDIEASIRKALEDEDVVLLYGNPGSGKSTLSRYIRDHYSRSPHGLEAMNKVATGSSRDDTVSEPRKSIVVFLECGRGAEVASKLLELYRNLISKPSSRKNFRSDQSVLIRKEIRSILAMQETLIILDDVWEQPFIKAFVGGLAFDLHGQVKFLITSRRATIWKSSISIEIPPVSLKNAERILAVHAGLADQELPSHLKGIAGRLIKQTECNPLALAMAGSRITKSKNTIDNEWDEVAQSYSTSIRGEVKGTGTSFDFTPVFDHPYEKIIWESLLMTYKDLSENSKRLLILIANCEGKTIPVQVVRRLYTKVQKGGHPTTCGDHLKQLRDGGTMLQVNVNSIAVFDPKVVHSSSEPYEHSLLKFETLGFHDLQRKFINNHDKTRDRVGELMDSLLDTCRDGSSSVQNTADEHRSASEEVLALCILYLRKQYAQRAAEHLGIRDPDFKLFKQLRVALGPLVTLLCEQLSEDEGRQYGSSDSEEESNQPSRRGNKGEVDLDKLITCAKQVMIYIVCNGELHDHSLVTLLSSLKFGPAIATVLLYLSHTRLSSTLKGHIPRTIQRLIDSWDGDISQPPHIRAVHLCCLPLLLILPIAAQGIQALPGAVEALVNSYWLDHEDSFVLSMYKTDTLGSMAYHAELQKKIGEVRGAIPKLLSLIQNDNVEIALQEALMGALCNLTSTNEWNRKQILVHHSGVEGLVKLLDPEKSSDFLGSLAITLGNVALGIEAEKKFGGVREAIPKLLSLIQKNSGEIALQKALMGALCNLTSLLESNRKQVLEHHFGVEGLVKLLEPEKSSDFLARLAQTLANVALEVEGAEKIGEVCGAIPKLLSLIQKETEDTALHEALMMALCNLTTRNESSRKQILEHDSGVEGLVKLLDGEKSSDFLGSLAGTLMNVGLEIEGEKKIGEVRGAIPKLLSLIQKDSGKTALQEALMMALCTLTTTNESNRKQILDHHAGVEGLVKLLEPEKSSLYLCGLAQTLANVALEVEGEEKIGEVCGAIPKLLSLIQKDSGEIALQEALMNTLFNLTITTESNRKQILEHHSGVEGLVKLLDREKSSQFLHSLVGTLANMTLEVEGANKIGEVRGAIPKLLSLIKKHSEEIALQEVLIKALCNLTTRNESSRKQILDHHSGVEGLVELLDSEKSSKYLLGLASTLTNVTFEIEGANKIGEVRGAIPKLLSLIQKDSGEIALQEALMKVLCNLANTNESNRKQILDHHSYVEGLVKLLEPERSSLYLCGLVQTLACLAMEVEGEKKVGDVRGAIPKLLSLIQKDSGDIALQEALMMALCNLTITNESNRKQILEYHSGVEGLVRLLDGEMSSDFLGCLATTLANVAREQEGSKKIGEVRGAIPKLLSLIQKDSGEIALQEALMMALCYLTITNESNRKQILDHHSGVEGLVKLLDGETSSDFLGSLATTLANVAIEEEGSKKIGEVRGAIPKLLSLIQEDSGEIALEEALMRALYHLTITNESNRKQILEDHSGVEALVKLLDGEKSSLYLRRSVLTLANVAVEIEGKKKIGEVRGAIPKLLSLILKEDGSTEFQEALMGTLHQLAMLEANRIQIMGDPGTMEGLVKLVDVGKGFRYLYKLCQTIYFLSIESEGAMKLGNVSGAISKVLTFILQDDGSIPYDVQEILVLVLHRLMVVKGNRRQILETRGGLEGLLQLVDGWKSSRYLEGVASILASVAIDAEGTKYAGVVSRAISKLVIFVLQDNYCGAFEAKLVESLLSRCLI